MVNGWENEKYFSFYCKKKKKKKRKRKKEEDSSVKANDAKKR